MNDSGVAYELFLKYVFHLNEAKCSFTSFSLKFKCCAIRSPRKPKDHFCNEPKNQSAEEI